MSELKPLVLYYLGVSGNPWKVAIILEELGIPYTTTQVKMENIKKEPFISLNPNGRAPVLVDPNNNDITLWESGAIIDYLIETYDKDATLTYTSSPEKHFVRVWEHFQMSGQGPYFGQAAWFNHFHPEKIPSAIERYEKEVLRVIGVVQLHLEKQGSEYLVGDKVTFADLMFVIYFNSVPIVAPTLDVSQYKVYNAWLARLNSRPAVKKIVARIGLEREKMEAEKAANGN